VTLSASDKYLPTPQARHLTGMRWIGHAAGSKSSRVIRYALVSTNLSPVVLSKITQGLRHSLTSPGSESSASNFRRPIKIRDTACIVTRSLQSTIASHLIPKRIASDGAKAIVERFVGEREAIGIHMYDTRIGVLLSANLDGWVSQRLGISLFNAVDVE
jgi:hypothetical protein